MRKLNKIFSFFLTLTLLFAMNHSVKAQCLLTTHNPNGAVLGPLTAPVNDCFVLTFGITKGTYALVHGLTPGNSYTVGNGQAGGLGGINAGGSGTTISVYDHATLALIPGATASSLGVGPLDGTNVTFVCPPGVTAVRVLISDNPCNGIILTGTNQLRMRCNTCAPVAPPPTTPALQLVNITSPLPGSVNVNTSNITLNWTAAGNAPQYYDLYFDNANGTTLLATVPGNVLLYSFTPANPLACNTTYTWRVVPRNCWGPATLTVTDVPPSSFTTTIGAPSVSPTLSTPAMNATNVATNATFFWGTVNGATMYDLYLDQVDGTTLFKSNIQATSLGLYGTAQYYPLVLPLLNCNTTYFWKVVAKNACGTSLGVSTYVSKFTTMNAIPTCPVLSAPANAATNQLTTPTLTWSAPANTVYYDIYLDNLVGPSAGTTLIKSNWNTTSFTLPLAMQLLCNTTYTWRVVAKNSCGESQNCTKRTFTTASGAPTCPTLSAPANAAINQSTLPTLTWSASTNAVAYDVYLDNLTGPSAATTLLQANVPTTSYAIPAATPLCAGIAYSWRVVAKNDCGQSIGCTPFTFSVINPNIACPTLSSPANASVGQSLTPFLSWTAPATVTPLFYDVYLDNGAGTTLYASNLTTTSLQVPHISPLQCNTLYTWKVFAKNGCGASVGCATFTFTTLTTAPTAPTPSAPANLGLVFTPTPQFTWLAATNAVVYKIYLDPGVVPSPTNLIATIPGNLTQFTLPNASALPCGSQYSWRVEAENGCGVTSSIATNTFTVSTPTVCPTHTPANLATNVSTTPLLSWTSVTGATGYDIYLVAGAGAPVPWVTNLNSTQLNYAVPLTQQLACNQLYTWRVVAKNACGINTVCPNFTFTTVNATTACATLSSPANASVNASLTPTFTWTAPASPNLASSYDLYLDAGLGGTTFIANIGGQGGTNAPNGSVPGSATPPTTYAWPQNTPLLCNTTYTWRIVPRFCGNTILPVATCPTTFTFTTINVPASVPIVTSVPVASLAAQICGSGSAVLTASGAAVLPGVTYQWLESVAPAGPFTPVTLGVGGNTTVYQSPVLTSTMHYQFQVTPINAGACLPVVSATYTVNVAAPPTVSVTPPGAVNYCVGAPTATPITVTSSVLAATVNPPATVTGSYPSYTLTPTATTTYTITTTDPATGCTASATKLVGVSTPVALSASANPTSACLNGNSTLTVTDTITGPSTLPALLSAYGVAAFTQPSEDELFNVTINGTTLNNSSDCATVAPGAGSAAQLYGNYTTGFPQTDLIAGASYTGSLRNGDCSFAGSQWTAIFIDYNRNGVFDLPAERVFGAPNLLTSSLFPGTLNPISFTLPASSQPGATLMRVIINEVNFTTSTGGSWGETEDYVVNIKATSGLPNSAFTWTGGPITGNPNKTVTATNISANTTYTVTATDGGGCTYTTTVTVTTATPVIATGITGTTTYCSATPNTTLTLTTSGGSTPITSVWTGGPVVSTTGLTAVLNPPVGTTIYTATATDACGTTSTSTVSITVNPTPSVILTPGSGTLCAGYTSNQVASGSGAPVYTWMPGSLTGASQALTPIANTTYTVTATDGPCSATASFTLTTTSSPTFSATTATPSLLCPGDVTSLTTSATLITGGTGPGAYTIATIPHAPVVPVGPTTAGPTGDDNLSAAIPLPFPFTFYGVVKNNVYISTNGYISFDPFAGAGCCTGQLLPSALTPNDLIAACWEDMNIGAGQLDYFTFGTAPNRKFVVRWINAVWFGGGGTNQTSQIVLNESDQSIEIHGTSGGPNASNNTTVGIENSTGTLGTAAPGKNSASPWLFANEAWRFSQQVITPVTIYAWDGGLTGNVVSPTLATTNANPSAATTYTVTATGSNGCTATSTVAVATKPIITGTATATPATICLGQSTTLNGNVPLICGGTETTFAGTYAPANWTFSQINSNGTVNTGGAPANIILTSGTNNSSNEGYTVYSKVIDCAGTVSFNWAYNTPDIAFLDRPRVRINSGVWNDMNGFNLAGASTQNGTQSLTVAAGDTVRLAAWTFDNDLGLPCTVTISNFSAPALPVTGFVNFWDAPTGGTLIGGAPSTVTPAIAGTTTYYAQYNTVNPAGCTNPVRLAIPVTVNAIPTVTASSTPSPATICSSTSLTLTGGGATTYTWTDGVNTPTDGTPFIPTASSTYTVTGTTSGCSSTATVAVTVISGTAPTAVGDTICGPGIANLTASGSPTDTLFWYTTASGGSSVGQGTSFNPNVSADSTFYVEGNAVLGSSTQSYLTGMLDNTAGGGQQISTNYNIFDVLSPSITLDSVTIYPGNTGPQTVNIQLANSSFTVLQTIPVAINPTIAGAALRIPVGMVIPAGTGYQLGQSASSISLFRNSTGVTYPYTVPGVVSITNSAAGSTFYYFFYNWRVSTGSTTYCPSATRTPVLAKVNPLPMVTASATPSSVCLGSSTTFTGGGASSYSWSDGSNTPTNAVAFTPPLAGTSTYTVIGTDANLCSATSTVSLSVNTLPATPIPSATPSSICEGGTSSLSTPVGPSTGPALDPGASCNPSYSSGNAFGDFIQNVNFGAINNTTGVNAVPANTFYPTPVVNVTKGLSYPLTVQVGTFSSNDVAVWVDFNRDGDYNDLGEKIGEVDNSGVSAIVPFTIAIPVNAQLGYTRMRIVEADQGTIGGMLPCAAYSFGESEDYQIDIQDVPPTIGWSGPATIASATSATTNVTPTTTGTLTYTVTVTDANGCTGTSSTTLTVNTLPVITATPATQAVCVNASATISGGGGTSYVWSGGISDATPFPVTSGPTTYTVTGTDGNGCSNTATAVVNMNALPTVTATPSIQTVCENASATISGGGATSYVWSGGISDATPFPVTSGPTTYTVTGTDGNGCSNTATAVVSMNAAPLVTAGATPTTTCNNTVVTPMGSGASTYTWSGGLTDNTPFVASATATYTVTGTDGIGCSATSSVTVTVTPASGTLAPATSNQSQAHNDDFNVNYSDASCNLIATVDDGAGGNILGLTTATVNVLATAGVHNGQPFVRRWYQITPTSNGSADVILYINQADFNDYNAAVLAPYLPLPTSGNNADPNIANIRITKNADAGLGNSPVVITPTVNWNGTYWELSFNTPSFSQFRVHSVNPGNIPLPATVTNFSGRKMSTSDMLEWTTASEQNNAYFNLQHGTDGINFTTIAKVSSQAPNGNSSSILNYSFENTKPQLGHNYYRLQQVDIDNQSTMNAKVVDIIWGTNGSTVSIYPNPTQDVLNIDLYTSKVQNTTVKVLDMSGRIVKQIQGRSEAGMNKLSISLGEIASGVYTVQVFENDNLTHVSKVKKND